MIWYYTILYDIWRKTKVVLVKVVSWIIDDFIDGSIFVWWNQWYVYINKMFLGNNSLFRKPPVLGPPLSLSEIWCNVSNRDPPWKCKADSSYETLRSSPQASLLWLVLVLVVVVVVVVVVVLSVCIYIYIYTYIHTYTHTHRLPARENSLADAPSGAPRAGTTGTSSWAASGSSPFCCVLYLVVLYVSSPSYFFVSCFRQ